MAPDAMLLRPFPRSMPGLQLDGAAKAGQSSAARRISWTWLTPRAAVERDQFFVAWHADERCEERGITAWQLVAGLGEAELVRERPKSKPNPSVVVRQILEDGTEVEVIWSWLSAMNQAKLVTVYLVE
jgi:hypothetical protein